MNNYDLLDISQTFSCVLERTLKATKTLSDFIELFYIRKVARFAGLFYLLQKAVSFGPPKGPAGFGPFCEIFC